MAGKSFHLLLLGAVLLAAASASDDSVLKPKPKPKPKSKDQSDDQDDVVVVGDDVVVVGDDDVLSLDKGYCSANNLNNFEQCGTNGHGAFSFCQLNANGHQLCFANFLCAGTTACASDADCSLGLTCAINNCGTVCTPQCSIDVTTLNPAYTVGDCWAANYVPSSENVLLDGADTGCDPNKRDAAGTYKCDDGSTSASVMSSSDSSSAETAEGSWVLITGGVLMVVLVSLVIAIAIFPRQQSNKVNNDILPETSEDSLVSSREVELEATPPRSSRAFVENL